LNVRDSVINAPSHARRIDRRNAGRTPQRRVFSHVLDPIIDFLHSRAQRSADR
jgi:hypothetical protein